MRILSTSEGEDRSKQVLGLLVPGVKLLNRRFEHIIVGKAKTIVASLLQISFIMHSSDLVITLTRC